VSWAGGRKGAREEAAASRLFIPVLLPDGQKKVVKLHKGSKEKLVLFM
jgi:hypothetical protein